MLELIDIKKDYAIAGGAVHALKGISLKFRKSEFVSILGASGCGKTTLLNIIGGLDKYTSGDLIIEGRSTKEFKAGDWDTYRNHSIGFIFQSYHLIPHQTILQNVELALTISGVSKEERRRRATEALEKVGLSDKLSTRPNQLSGGQAQRVAIARALINDPEIVLADEPTGALDSKTSVQIMELLKEISKDRLVIMVTHNPELAEQYSTRIIRLLDGVVTDDTMPYGGEDERSSDEQKQAIVDDIAGATEKKKNKGRKKKSSMSRRMAFSLSLKNLLSKGKRTALVSIAGSIGIIGVSMVLAISAGVRAYISDVEDDMLSGYPLSVTETAIDFNAIMDFASSAGVKVDAKRLKDKVYVESLLDTLMGFNQMTTTNIITEDYKNYVDNMPKSYYNALQYGYDFDMSNYIYTDFKIGDPDGTEMNASVTAIRAMYTSVLGQQEDYGQYSDLISTISSFEEIPNNYEYILSQYDVLATYKGDAALTDAELKAVFEGEESLNSLIMVIDDNAFSDLNFGQYGYMTEDEFLQFAYKAAGKEYDPKVIEKYNGENGTDFSFFLDGHHTFSWYPNDSIYSETDNSDMFMITGANGIKIPVGKYMPNEEGGYDVYVPYKYNPTSESFSQSDKVDLKVKIILQKKKGVSYGCLQSGLYYTEALTKHTIAAGKDSNIVKDVAENYGGKLKLLPFNYSYTYFKGGEWKTASDSSLIGISGDMMTMMMGAVSDGSVDLDMLAGKELPTAFFIYPLNFEYKDFVTEYLDKWNEACESESGTLVYTDLNGNTVTVEGLEEADKVKYTDAVGLIITMVNTMIKMVTIALVAFTALALVVSTVMVGIITYVSVVERIKEIGILRAVGARKKDIKRLFNAETFIIGLAAGIVGIVVTYLLSLIINLVLGHLFGISTIAALPFWQALVMIGISVGLTLISGLIPAAAAAKKDPVVALRTE